MVYRKKTVRKTYRKKPTVGWYDRKYSAMDMARKALKNVHYIKGMINCEKKYNDQSNILMNQSINTSGVIQLISGIPQGDGDSQRDGNSVLARSLLIRGSLNSNMATGAIQNQVVRMIIFQDKNVSGGVTPTVSDILEAANVGTERAPFSPLNVHINGRVKILRDRLLKTIKTQDTGMMIVNEYIKLYTHLKFNGSLGTNVSGGAIYALFVNGNDSWPCEADLLTRIGFYDN